MGKVPIRRYSEDAASWSTCAVGEAKQGPLGAFIMTSPDYFDSPRDNQLFKLGVDFDLAIRAGSRPRARQIYRQIIARVNQLSKEPENA